jgi:hypothetical protein
VHCHNSQPLTANGDGEREVVVFHMRVRVGPANQQDLLKSQTELDLAENDPKNLESQRPCLGTRLNARLSRAAPEDDGGFQPKSFVRT